MQSSVRKGIERVAISNISYCNIIVIITVCDAEASGWTSLIYLWLDELWEPDRLNPARSSGHHHNIKRSITKGHWLINKLDILLVSIEAVQLSCSWSLPLPGVGFRLVSTSCNSMIWKKSKLLNQSVNMLHSLTFRGISSGTSAASCDGCGWKKSSTW